MDARDIDLRLDWACDMLGIEVPEVVWEDDYHEEPAENGSEAPAWVNHGEWDIHLHRDAMAYVADGADLAIPGHLERVVRHTAWHELGHLWDRRLTLDGDLLMEVAGYYARTGLNSEEIIAEGIAQLIIVRLGEPLTSRYDFHARENMQLLSHLADEIQKNSDPAVDPVPIDA